MAGTTAVVALIKNNKIYCVSSSFVNCKLENFRVIVILQNLILELL